MFPLSGDGTGEATESKARTGTASGSSAPTPGRSSVGGTHMEFTPTRKAAAQPGVQYAVDDSDLDRTQSPVVIGAPAGSFNNQGVTTKVATAEGLKELQRVVKKRATEAADLAQKKKEQQRIKAYEDACQQSTTKSIRDEKRRQKKKQRVDDCSDEEDANDSDNNVCSDSESAASSDRDDSSASELSQGESDSETPGRGSSSAPVSHCPPQAKRGADSSASGGEYTQSPDWHRLGVCSSN